MSDFPVIDVKGVTINFPLSFDLNMTARAKVSIKIKDLLAKRRKRRKKRMFRALSEVSFRADKGEVIGVIGPNGCGKTTLLRTICGIYEPDAGSIETRGRMSTLLSLGTGFNNNLSGRTNIYLGGYLMGLTKPEIEERIDAIIGYADLGEHIDTPVKFYSSGMISRLGFAISSSLEPEILLIDEVFSVGDLAFRQKSEKTIQSLLETAHTQLIVTHNLEFVRTRCTRALLIRKGELVADGDPDAVVDEYEEWVASHAGGEFAKIGSRFVAIE